MGKAKIFHSSSRSFWCHRHWPRLDRADLGEGNHTRLIKGLEKIIPFCFCWCNCCNYSEIRLEWKKSPISARLLFVKKSRKILSGNFFILCAAGNFFVLKTLKLWEIAGGRRGNSEKCRFGVDFPHIQARLGQSNGFLSSISALSPDDPTWLYEGASKLAMPQPRPRLHWQKNGEIYMGSQ